MSLLTITSELTNQPVKLKDAEKHRVLTTLKMMYEGGSLDGKTANFPTRDLFCVVVGFHRRHCHFFETYKRTIWVNIRNRRTIFRYAGHAVKSSHNRSWWKRLLAVLHVRKPRAIVI